MTSYKKLINNTLIYALGNFGSKTIAFIMLPFYTLYLSTSEYGEIDLIVTTLGLIIPLLTGNIVEAVVRFSIDKKKYSYTQVLSNSIIFWITSILLLLLLYPLLVSISYIERYLFLFYILFSLQSLHGIVKQFSRSANLNFVYVSSDILYTIYFVLCNFIFLYFFDLGVYGYLVAIIIATLIDLAFLIIKTKFLIKINFLYFNKEIILDMFRYCLPLIPNSLMWWIMGISDRYIINFYLGLGATGIYAVATKFPTIVSMFSNIFFKAWQISAVEEYTNEKKNNFYSNIFNSFFTILSILCSFYLIFNEIFINLLVSEQFSSTYKYVPFLILGVFFSSLVSFTGTNYTVVKKNGGAFLTALIGAIINISLNIILIPIIDLYGAVISTAISYFIVWVLRLLDTRKFIKVSYSYFKIIVTIVLLSLQATTIFMEDKTVFYFINISIFLINIFIGYATLKIPIKYFYIRTILKLK